MQQINCILSFHLPFSFIWKNIAFEYYGRYLGLARKRPTPSSLSSVLLPMLAISKRKKENYQDELFQAFRNLFNQTNGIILRQISCYPFYDKKDLEGSQVDSLLLALRGSCSSRISLVCYIRVSYLHYSTSIFYV